MSRFYCPEPAVPRLGSWLLAVSLVGVIELFLSLVGIVFLYLVDWVLVLLTHCCPSGSVFAAGMPVGFLSRYFGCYRAFDGAMGEACIVGVIAATCITLIHAYWRSTWCQRYEVCCRCSAIEPISLPPGLYCHLICGFPFSRLGYRVWRSQSVNWSLVGSRVFPGSVVFVPVAGGLQPVSGVVGNGLERGLLGNGIRFWVGVRGVGGAGWYLGGGAFVKVA